MATAKPDAAAPIIAKGEGVATDPAAAPVRKVDGRAASACIAPDGAVTVVDQPIVAHHSWEDLGLPSDARAALGHEPIAFHAAPGSTTFERVVLPGGVRADDLLLETTGSGFTAVAGSYASKTPTSTVLSSADGRTWSATPGPAVSMGWNGAALGTLGGGEALIGGDDDGPVLALRNGGAWTTAHLVDAISPSVADRSRASLMAAGIGPLGAVAVVSITPDAIAKAGGVVLTDRGWTLRVLDERVSLDLVDPTGAVVGHGRLGDLGTDGVLREGPEGSVVAMKDGVEVARFAGRAIKQSFAQATPPTTTYRVLTSLDGHVWSDEPLADLVGADATSVARVLVTGQRAVLAAQLAGSPSKQVAVVGSKRR
jgi:hypothetical protein